MNSLPIIAACACAGLLFVAAPSTSLAFPVAVEASVDGTVEVDAGPESASATVSKDFEVPIVIIGETVLDTVNYAYANVSASSNAADGTFQYSYASVGGDRNTGTPLTASTFSTTTTRWLMTSDDEEETGAESNTSFYLTSLGYIEVNEDDFDDDGDTPNPGAEADYEMSVLVEVLINGNPFFLGRASFTAAQGGAFSYEATGDFAGYTFEDDDHILAVNFDDFVSSFTTVVGETFDVTVNVTTLASIGAETPFASGNAQLYEVSYEFESDEGGIAYVWTPIPEPATGLGLAGAAVTCLRGRTRLRRTGGGDAPARFERLYAARTQ